LAACELSAVIELKSGMIFFDFGFYDFLLFVAATHCGFTIVAATHCGFTIVAATHCGFTIVAIIRCGSITRAATHYCLTL
jgi:hypothetical protein